MNLDFDDYYDVYKSRKAEYIDSNSDWQQRNRKDKSYPNLLFIKTTKHSNANNRSRVLLKNNKSRW